MITASNENRIPGLAGMLIRSQVTLVGCNPAMKRDLLPPGEGVEAAETCALESVKKFRMFAGLYVVGFAGTWFW